MSNEVKKDEAAVSETTAPKKTTKTTAPNEEADLRKRVDELAEQNAKLMSLLLKMQETQTPNTVSTNLTDKVKIVHLVQRENGLATVIRLSNLVISMSDFGEVRSVTMQQFEELVGNYRSWFTQGLISVAEGYEEVAATYGVSTKKGYPLNSEFVRNLGTYSIAKIEEVYEKLPIGGKACIIEIFNRKAIQGETGFNDIRKLEALNRISDGGCDGVLASLKAKK